MISINRSLLVGCIVFLLVGCGEKPKETARVPPPTAPPSMESPAGTPTPAPETHPVTEKTREVYQWYCTQCHGVTGKGNGINAKLLTVPPRDHTKADYLETRTDRQLFDAIQQGGLAVGRAPCMPSWGDTLDADTIHSLVRYIRELCECEAI
jgi:mono/diheme cytochrome c family protein